MKQLPADIRAFIAMGVSTIVASRDAQLRPSVMRAVGSSVSADGGEVTVFLSRPQSRQLLQDIAAGGPVAAVFSQPTTHRTVQVKGSQAQLRNATAEDEPRLADYLAAFSNELTSIGFAPELPRAMLSFRIEEVVAITFRPEQAFDQTPGPKAGTRLELES